MTVNFAVTGQSISTPFFLEDKEIMRKVMYGLRDKAVPRNKAYFEKLLSEHPLLPGDEPTPFTYAYDENAYLAASNAVWGKAVLLTPWTNMVNRPTEAATANPEPPPVVETPATPNPVTIDVPSETEPPVIKDETPPPPPVAAEASRRPTPLFYVAVGVLLCAGAALYFTRKR